MQFSDKIYNAKPGYTYDDFLLVPNASWIEAKDVDTKVSLTKDIKLNIPIMSAAMDTVTEAELAIAMAQQTKPAHLTGFRPLAASARYISWVAITMKTASRANIYQPWKITPATISGV